MIFKRQFLVVLGLLSLVVISQSSCEYNNEEALYGCDSTQFTYSAVIVPLLEQNCYRCHAGNDPSSGFDLSTYDLISPYTDTTNAVGAPLLCFIKQENPACEDFYMPPLGGPVDPCVIRKIELWIEDGAPDN